MNSRIYDPNLVGKIAVFYKGLKSLIDEFEGQVGDQDEPYIYSLEIIFQHPDNWTIGRIGMDDFPFFEITDEDYGKSQNDGQASRAEEINDAVMAHVRQEDTASGANL